MSEQNMVAATIVEGILHELSEDMKKVLKTNADVLSHPKLSRASRSYLVSKLPYRTALLDEYRNQEIE